MFSISFHTHFHMRSYNGLLEITVKPKYRRSSCNHYISQASKNYRAKIGTFLKHVPTTRNFRTLN